MKHLYKLIFFFLLMPNIGLAQGNLVPNPSFEDTTACPQWLGNFFAAGWNSPTYGSPDLFHNCSSGQLGVPQNVLGWQQPRTGLAYAGIWASDFSGNNYREYIQCRLTQPLEHGETYEVSFWLSRADSATKACDNIGAYFSSIPVSALITTDLPYVPQIVSEANVPITDAANWIQVIDTFIAIGGEEYLTIGIFTDDANTNWISTLGGWTSEPYYYIDDVSVEKVLVSSTDEAIEYKITVFPNPSVGQFSVLSNERIKSVSVYSAFGQKVKGHTVNDEKFEINLDNYPPGIYFLVVETNYSFTTHKLILNTKP